MSSSEEECGKPGGNAEVWSLGTSIPANFEELRSFLDRCVDKRFDEGSVLKILFDGKEVFKHVAGKCAEDSIFRLYSMTKSIVCVVFLQLCAENKVKLEDLLTDFLPCFATTPLKGRANGPPITMRQLMTHTSGLDYGPAVTMPARRPGRPTSDVKEL
eukprot:GEMP01122756.1.p1 GENE.GEMP01122756.1~~GEMP01122756.1.p1  ORF type:complete len:165 (+),score=37.43 GEMP01122756.1:23-496(+)